MIEILIAYKLSDDFVATYVKHEKSFQIVLTSRILMWKGSFRDSEEQKKMYNSFTFILLTLRGMLHAGHFCLKPGSD